MKKISETVVFFGSGPVAAKSLELLAAYMPIEAVITKPRAPHHRGSVPVIEVAQRLGLPILTADSRQALNHLIKEHQLASRLGVLVDFGIIVSANVIDYFSLGIVNSHFSLLPEWRGADPITFSILSGQRYTGVSLMLLVPALDEGPLLAQSKHPIKPHITTPQLTDELVALSDGLLQQTLPLYLQNKLKPVNQLVASISDVKIPTYSRKLSKNDGLLDWKKPATVLEREIRAFAEWPRSSTKFGNIEVIITSSEVAQVQGEVGNTTIINKLPAVYCGKDSLLLTKLKPSGKKEMTGQAFLAGYKKPFLGHED